VRPFTTFIIAALFSLTAAGLVFGERATPPETLVVGYENEAKIDASREACVAHVKEVTEWSEAETQRGAREVCAARRKHIDAYIALQASYRAFIRALTFDRRLDWDEGASTVPTLVKTCMTHKFSLTTGGHNIRIDIINNEITASCLTLISNLLREETRQLTRR
jgi:hypothetical protein